MTNRHQPHVLVLPEDDANSRIANGFLLELDQSLLRKIQVFPVAGGWRAVLDRFVSDHVADMDRYTKGYMVLLIDFDGVEGRLSDAKQKIPERLSDRVFILGAWTAPERLKSALGPYETIGSALARDCREGTDTTWGHDLLRHNATEIGRLRRLVRPILFAAR
jgi:hypothetical protein